MSERLTYKEIAERYRRSRSTVVNRWATHDAWPGHVGMRGSAKEFDAEAIERFVAAHIRPPAPSLDGEDDELLDIGEVSAVAGYGADSIWSMIGHGRWPRPVGRRQVRDEGGEATRGWESLWRLGDIRVELERRRA